MNFDLYDRILGSLATAGLGDAMGAATEQWCTEEIYVHYGGPVRDLYDPPPDTFAGAAGNKIGQITTTRAKCTIWLKVISRRKAP